MYNYNVIIKYIEVYINTINAFENYYDELKNQIFLEFLTFKRSSYYKNIL